MEEWLSVVEAEIAQGAELDWDVSCGEYPEARLVADFLERVERPAHEYAARVKRVRPPPTRSGLGTTVDF
jgi:hypothetical protein